MWIHTFYCRNINVFDNKSIVPDCRRVLHNLYHSCTYSHQASPSVYFYKMCGVQFHLYLFLKSVQTFQVVQTETVPLLLLDLLFLTCKFFPFTTWKGFRKLDSLRDYIAWKFGGSGFKLFSSTCFTALSILSVAAFLLPGQGA